ncbi:protein tyrosine phosphatase, partial [Corynebacterium variabile]
MNILFVCTGNICRSPVAEFLLRDLVREGHTVSSAGIAGLSGYAMDPRSVEYLRLRGIDGNEFAARRVSRRILKEPDLIIGFEQEHVNECLALEPAAISRTFRLCQLAAWQRNGDLTSLTDLP